MKNLNEEFQQFAKKDETKAKVRGINCVIYTRVSTKEQADNNLSLDIQRKACQSFAEKQGYNIVEYFGGTYESAKTDERNEFNRMLKLVKKINEKISYIIVYSVDRFSRSGANAIYIASELKKQGIMIIAVTQPTDSNTASGSLQQNIHFIFSEYDNQMRREKCMAGVREKLLMGIWVTQAPLGYDHVTINGQREIVVNDKGKILRKAFEWKANEGLMNAVILKKLSAMGLKISRQKLTDTIKNPFYCGLLVHNMLDGQVIEGKHERLVSKEIFLRANEVHSKVPQGWKANAEDENIPLKKFMKCAVCGSNMRGYIVRKKKIYYYKCGKEGCGCNENAQRMHGRFLEMLKPYVLDEKNIEILKYQLEETFNEINQTNLNNVTLYKIQLKEVEKKLERLEERFVEEEITKEQYTKFSAKYVEERQQILASMDGGELKTSNLIEYIDKTLEIAVKLQNLWVSSDYRMKQKLQYLVFPEGIYFDKKKGECRTGRGNLIFEIIACVSENIRQKKSGHSSHKTELSGSVAGSGVEPPTSGL